MGVFATAPFIKGSFLCEYTGDLLKAKEGYEREKTYAKSSGVGSFLIFFRHNDEHLW